MEELDRYEHDLEQLARFERGAEDDLAMVDGLDTWHPTAYEQFYLPGVRLAGIEDKNRVTLQNVADLHIHTHYSDGDQLERVLEFAAKAHLDAIAITDHDVIGGALEARRIVHERRLPFAVIPGVEVSSRDGHIGALFVTKVIEPDMSAADTVAAIHAAGGLAIAHHPFAPPLIEKLLRVKLGCGDLVHTVDFDAIECTNAVPGYGRKYNIEAYEELAKRKVRIGMTGSSDAHNAALIGKGTTYYAGNEGLLSAKTALEYGFIHGAEGYWRFSEKLRYRWALAKAVWRNLLQGGNRSSVN
ncbi:MAG: putative metal-dependent phosphoesterase TrpH [Pseudohongiellaceae bacterium]|jgi:predicted metal-dependent phosphoesterase TrpH